LPSSRWDNIPDIIYALRKIKPKSILDVGCGFGKWGFLAREYLDVWDGNYYKDKWQTRIDAVEIFPQYIQPWHKIIYDNIFIGDIQEILLEEYDLIIACDVLEHIPEERVSAVMQRLRHWATSLIVSVPLGIRPQGKEFDNEFEIHRSTWTLDKIKSYNPHELKIHGQQALAVWYSKTVLFISDYDWANMGYLLAKSLQSVGVDARAITFHKHPFGYTESAEICMAKSYEEYGASANIIVAMHSTWRPWSAEWNICNNKKLFVFHGGSIYRQNYEKINKFFNPVVTSSIVQHWDFINKGAKNPYWLLPPVDLSIEPDYTYHNKLFAHYPRHPKIKGSEIILRVLPNIDYSEEIIPHQANLERISKCDIYIEQLCEHEWGLTALEAAALGKIVITTFRGLEEYRRQYGECELIVANTESELRQRVNEIMVWNEEQILEKKIATRKWAEKYHSFKAVGQRLKGIIEDRI